MTQKELLKILEEQMKLTENRFCADCKEKCLFINI
jgi:hypothetical protein